MKQFLLPSFGNFYKANLHTHATVSDGTMSPEEIKKIYVENGYSIVAFTDHEIMVPHTELNDKNFLAITSTEVAVNSPEAYDFSYAKTYHLNIYSNVENKNVFSTFDDRIIWLQHSLDYIPKEQLNVKFKRIYSADCINELISKANDEDCLVCLNHPVWSIQDYSDYIGLRGLWGVEWFNSSATLDGYLDSIKPIDDLLRIGEKVFPIAADDTHNLNACFGGFVMIKAKELEYSNIFNALKNGDFYSSTGPEIFELWYEDKCVYIKTSKVKKIILTTERRVSIVASGEDYISEAYFDIKKLFEIKDDNLQKHYFRITVIDEFGKHAYTRAYFLDEFLNKC